MPTSGKREEATAPTVHVRDRILQAASDLFYREGVHAVGIDRILREANAAKASLYAHFKSKDELVAHYLEQRGSALRQCVTDEMEKRGGSAQDRLLHLFDLLASWSREPEFRGCPFINAAGELCDADHPAHAVSRDHRRWMRNLVRDLVEETGTKDVEKVTQSILILQDGAASAALVDGKSEAAATARWAVQELLERG